MAVRTGLTRLTFSRDELWLLYQLAQAHEAGPCVLGQRHVQHEYEGRAVLAKLSAAVLTAQEKEAPDA